MVVVTATAAQGSGFTYLLLCFLVGVIVAVVGLDGIGFLHLLVTTATRQDTGVVDFTMTTTTTVTDLVSVWTQVDRVVPVVVVAPAGQLPGLPVHQAGSGPGLLPGVVVLDQTGDGFVR